MGKWLLDKSTLTAPLTQSVYSSIVERLVGSLDIEKIILFGSYASGVPTKDSDIDLLVILNTKEKGIKRYALVSELLEPREAPMDIIIKTSDEIKKRARYFDPFMNRIFKNGKVLYEKKT